MFYTNSIYGPRFIDEKLYKRYIDDINDNSHGRDLYHEAIRTANDGTGKISIPFMRCMLYCEYQYKNGTK